MVALQRTAILKDIADRYQRLDSEIREGRLTLPRAISSYAFTKDAGTLALSNPGAALPAEATAEYIPFTISTSSIDRDGDVCISSGCDITYYSKNPVVFFGHQQWEIPIGTSRDPRTKKLSVFVEKDKVRAYFYPDRSDSDSMLVFAKVLNGFLSAASIAFIPLDAHRREPARKAEGRGGPDMGGWVFRHFQLTEWSIVGVPANAEAIAEIMTKEKSFMSPRLRKSLEPYAAQAKGRSFSGWCNGGDCGCTVKTGQSLPTQAAIESDDPRSQRTHGNARLFTYPLNEMPDDPDTLSILERYTPEGEGRNGAEGRDAANIEPSEEELVTSFSQFLGSFERALDRGAFNHFTSNQLASLRQWLKDTERLLQQWTPPRSTSSGDGVTTAVIARAYLKWLDMIDKYTAESEVLVDLDTPLSEAESRQYYDIARRIKAATGVDVLND